MTASQWKSRPRRTVGIGLALGCAAVLSGAAAMILPRQDPQQFELDECPRYWERLPKRLGGRLAPNGIVLAGPITDIPEFHDCQRLLIESGKSYGPLTAVFASQHLDTLFGASLSQVDSARAAAVILNLGPGEYDPLRLQAGFTCLYLWPRGSSDSTSVSWAATLLWVDRNQRRCQDVVALSSLDTSFLEVRRTGPQDSMDLFPPVARWDWDSTRLEHYVGIKCGRGWCEIGRRGSDDRPFTPSVAYLSMSGAEQMVQRIKGWYDEQFLAVEQPGGEVEPSGVRGTVFPAPGRLLWAQVQSRSREPTPARRWMNVAYIAIDRSSQHYKRMLNLDPVARGSRLEDMNVLAFCYGGRSHCGVPAPMLAAQAAIAIQQGLPRLAPNRGCDNGAHPVLWVRIKPASRALGEADMYRCVTRKTHEIEHPRIPATARWRWLVEDETVWRECTQGCCEVEVADGDG